MDAKSENHKNGTSDHGEAMDEGLSNSESRTPLKTPTKETEVKLIPLDSINREAKVHLDEKTGGFSGMSKEELLKYVNDPFWVRMRTTLFILFWVTWVAMFVAAVYIIVKAPRCDPLKAKQWFEEGPIFKVDLLKNGKSLSDLSKQIDALSNLQVKGLILPDITQKVDGNTVDFKTVDKNIGTLEDLTTLLKLAKAKAIAIILSFVPNHSSNEHEWFTKSVFREEPYDSYYIWKSSVSADALPNNWLTRNDTPAWTWHPDRKEFYLHQFGTNQPDLNFRSQKVKEEFDSIFQYWLSLGVSGFSLDKAQYLLEDEALENEVVGARPGAPLNQYQFWSHMRTYNLPQVADLLASWRDLVRLNDSNHALFISGQPPIAANMNMTVADLVREEPLLDTQGVRVTASGLLDRVLTVLKRGYHNWPAVEATSSGQYIAHMRLAPDPLNLIISMLPGTPIIQLGDERGVTTDAAAMLLANASTDNAHYALFKEAAELRSTPAVLHGSFNITVVNNGSVLAVTRYKSGSPGYVAVWNDSPLKQTVDLSGIQYLPKELISVAFGITGGPDKDTHINTDSVSLLPDATVLFTFVPSTEE